MVTCYSEKCPTLGLATLFHYLHLLYGIPGCSHAQISSGYHAFTYARVMHRVGADDCGNLTRLHLSVVQSNE